MHSETIQTLTWFLVTSVFIGTPISTFWYLYLLKSEKDNIETKNNLSHKIVKPPLRIILSLIIIIIGSSFIYIGITEPYMPIYSDLEESVRIARIVFNFFALICTSIVTLLLGFCALHTIWGNEE